MHVPLWCFPYTPPPLSSLTTKKFLASPKLFKTQTNFVGYCESEDKSAFLHSNQENEELKQYKTDELTLEHESVKEQEQITEATKEDVKAKDEIEKVQEEETNVSEVMLEDGRIKQKRDEINERKPLG